MELISLKLENFQGIKKFQIEINGRTSIYGDNATGKTTVANAITWLLFDQSSQGIKNFTPKTIGENGELHNLEHSVEATFRNETGKVTFKKSFKEVYKKKRGSTYSEFSGHTTEYYKDGVPLKLKEYEEALEAFFLVKKDIMKQLMTPFYFPEVMSWQDRRQLLIDICGDISDDDILKEFSEDDRQFLENQLEGRTIEEQKKVVSSTKSKINKSLTTIPERIDEVAKGLVEDLPNKETLKANLEKFEEEIAEMLERKSNLENETSGKAMAKARLIEAQAEYREAQSNYNNQVLEIERKYQKGLDTIKNKASEFEQELTVAKTEVKQIGQELERLKSHKASILEKVANLQATSWDENEAVCPCCKRALPEEQVEELKERFNLDKSKKLEALIEEGKMNCSSHKIAVTEAKKVAMEKEIVSLENAVKDVEEAVDFYIKQNSYEITPFEETKEANDLTIAIKDIEDEINGSYPLNKEEIDQIECSVGEMKAIVEDIKKNLFIIENNESILKRINELEAQEQDLAEAYEEAERVEFLCDEFTKAKVKMLTENINKHFKTCEFRLFKEQINGGISEDCEVLIPNDKSLIPYSFANNASRINTGLEIINVLSKYYQTSLPVIVDNAESVTKMAEIDNQVIRLVVSEKDQEMRVEHE